MRAKHVCHEVLVFDAEVFGAGPEASGLHMGRCRATEGHGIFGSQT
jgi:hypothetical protein